MNLLRKIKHLVFRIIKAIRLIFIGRFAKEKRSSMLTPEEAERILEGKFSYDENTLRPIALKNDRMLDLSVIIPIHNREKYLEQCVDSAIEQDTHYKYEIICVDDGSTDASSGILKEYAERYGIKVITQKNAGASAARNRGLEEASGNYILFIDDDDFIEQDMIEILLDKAYAEDADIVKCAYNILPKNRGRFSVRESRSVTLRNDAIAGIYSYSGLCCGAIYRRRLFALAGFPEGFIFEDMLIHLSLFPQCKVFSYVAKPLYNYRMHDENATKKTGSKGNYKVLSQLYLPCLFYRYTKNAFAFEKELKAAYQYEFEQLLYNSCTALTEEEKRAVFCLSADFLCKNELIQYDTRQLKRKQKLYREAFANGNYFLWKKLSEL